MRSSSAILSRSGWLLWPVAWRATMTIPSIVPEGCRNGTAWARTKIRDPSDRTEANVPSHGPAVEHLLGQLGRLAEVFLLETQREQGPADQALRRVGEPEQLSPRRRWRTGGCSAGR